MMRAVLCQVAHVLWLLSGSGAMAGEAIKFTDRFCVLAPHYRLCPDFPHDQTDFDRNFEYRVLVKGAQDPFDVFSWQAFVALNWPVAGDGTPLAEIGSAPEALRAWQRFIDRDSLFGRFTTCPVPDDPATLIIRDLVQADGNALIDQAGNFTVYQTRANPVAAGYIRQNDLLTIAGQRGAGSGIAFPLGRLDGADEPRQPASILLKTAWRILPPHQTDDYLTRPSVLEIPAEYSASGSPACLAVTLGMVGMHIVTRTQSGNGNEWIWSTFEHRANAPVAGNARNVNSIYSNDLFPGGCAAPPAAGTFSYFRPDCPDCPTNAPPIAAKWADAAPFALADGKPVTPSQIVRCWDIFPSTASVNELWQARLSGTVFANYMVVSTQWRGANKSPLFEHGEVPRFLTNTTMETFQQTADDGTCLGCHAGAATAAGTPSNFTFLLREAN